MGTKPRVYYIGLPRIFVAGCVYDPEADEIVEGALVTLIPAGLAVGAAASGTDGLSGGPAGPTLAAPGPKPAAPTPTTTTDEFGDFWIEGLDRGTYSVLIEREGYTPIELGPVAVDKDLNLGDLPMHATGGGRP